MAIFLVRLIVMELYRKAYAKLIKWKQKNEKNPLIIDGLRQVGKTHIARRLGKEEYENFVFYDLRYDKGAREIFSQDTPDRKITVDTIIQRTRVRYPDDRIEPGKTLLIFDEINDCPEARESLKLFVPGCGYDVIATGSLLGLSDFKVKNIPAGYDAYLTLKPLDFEEFLIASGVSERTIDLIYESLRNQTKIDNSILDALHAYFLRYVVVGGIPRAVIKYLETNDLVESREVLTNLLKDYVSDFGTRYKDDGAKVIDAKLFVKTSMLFASIHTQLAKDKSKKFKYKDIEGGGRSGEFSEAIAWLEKTGLIVRCFNTSAVETPLEGNATPDKFKIYFPDIGLLVASYPVTLLSEILSGNLGAYKGAIYESIAAEALYKAEVPLYYHEDTLKHLENDFLVETKDGIDVYEVKSSNGKLASAKALLESDSPYKHQIHGIYKLIDARYGKGDFYETMPRFLLGFKMAVEEERLLSSLKLPPLPKI